LGKRTLRPKPEVHRERAQYKQPEDYVFANGAVAETQGGIRRLTPHYATGRSRCLTPDGKRDVVLCLRYAELAQIVVFFGTILQDA
jgi:hypothetical protein